ncbi:unnamed protein product [Schistosoma curassoni]|uniref:Uncharacterized protein n=1 Tax=Schistosoma curassoni TaxID=6186 RepID=A0A183L335_9TREM|nr:unnamed protein product [Schistosoma curassoni]
MKMLLASFLYHPSMFRLMIISFQFLILNWVL